jgi:hypothetical protein
MPASAAGEPGRPPNSTTMVCERIRGIIVSTPHGRAGNHTAGRFRRPSGGRLRIGASSCGPAPPRVDVTRDPGAYYSGLHYRGRAAGVMCAESKWFESGGLQVGGLLPGRHPPRPLPTWAVKGAGSHAAWSLLPVAGYHQGVGVSVVPVIRRK